MPSADRLDERPDDEPGSFSPPQAALVLRVSTRQLERYKRAGLIECKLDGHRVRYTTTALANFLAAYPPGGPRPVVEPGRRSSGGAA